MARLNVNPTRVELRRLKARLATAVRGHKLLKDKSDEMIRQFMARIRRNRELREMLEPEISAALRSFAVSRSMMLPQETEAALSMPSYALDMDAGTAYVMGLAVPKITIKENAGQELFPYSFITTASALDNSISRLLTLLQGLVKLAEVEKACNMLADEIEKNRRRVNALEYILIPQIEETIKYIKMKLDENERGNLIRLMKVKEILNKK